MLRRGEYPLIPRPILPRCGREGEKKNSPLCHFGGEAAKMTQLRIFFLPFSPAAGEKGSGEKGDYCILRNMTK